MIDHNRSSVLSMPHIQDEDLTARPHETGTTAPVTRLMGQWASLLLMAFMVQGCGLVVDAIKLVWPIATNELDAI
jgi:hypothetical protein